MSKMKRDGCRLSKAAHRPTGPCSIFDLPADFFDSCCLVSNVNSSPQMAEFSHFGDSNIETSPSVKPSSSLPFGISQPNRIPVAPGYQWSCRACKAKFTSLLDQRSHFKSDFHRFNIKMSVSGHGAISEEQFEELCSEYCSSEECDFSSLSGSEKDDKDDDLITNEREEETSKRKLFVLLNSGVAVSFWRCLLFDGSEESSVSNKRHGGCELLSISTERLKNIVQEPRDGTRLRAVLLASGGHFAGCIFDGNVAVAHKTFHRYVVRAKAGKKQSSKDATGKAAKSAGAVARRHNELAFKKEVQELLLSWRPYFDACSSIFIHAPASNRQLFYDGKETCFAKSGSVQHIPLTVHKPTLKEVKRVYGLLTVVVYEN